MGRTTRAPRGTQPTCKGWLPEAALRMLMNNLDPEVAEKPAELIVYGGRGKAARSWEAFDAIVRCLRELENDETLLVQSGKPVGVFKTHPDAPRVLIANANLVPARQLIDQGGALALATDLNPGTCYCESIPFIIALACRAMQLSPAEAITAATLNAAHAIGCGDRLGSLEAGKQADSSSSICPTIASSPIGSAPTRCRPSSSVAR